MDYEKSAAAGGFAMIRQQMRICLMLLLIIGLRIDVLAQALTWAHFVPTGTGPVLNSNPAVYDPTSNSLIVFGGLEADGSCCTNDTWVLRNANGVGGTPAWQKLAPTGTLPPARQSHSAVYDTNNNRLIIFAGGILTSQCGSFCVLYNDVWVLSNANGNDGTPVWNQLTPAGVLPPVRSAQAAVYDPTTNRMVIFGGGNDGINDLNDTWVLTNANGIGNSPEWIQLSPTGGPPSPREVAMVSYDQVTNTMTIFGGSFQSDLWTLSNANGAGDSTPTWQLETQNSPAPGTLSNWNYGHDQANNALIFFGGSPSFGTFRNDVWELHNANGIGTPTWQQLIPNGQPGSPPAGAFIGSYDPNLKRVMIIPDPTDLWVLPLNSNQSTALPVLFVPGICENADDLHSTENSVTEFLQQTYPDSYSDPHQHWVFYDGFQVNFEIPFYTETSASVPSSSRFFAVAFDDPTESLVQNFNPLIVAGLSIYQKADELAHIVWKIKSLTGAPRVLLVTHSMGGLVSRAYIETLANGLGTDIYLNDVSTLITIDTPHGGSWLSYVNFIDVGKCLEQQTEDKIEMHPSGDQSVIPVLNYFMPGASPLPPALTAYSIVSYWTIPVPLDLVDPFGLYSDNVLDIKTQDLNSNLRNPAQDSQSNLIEVRNPYGSAFGQCGLYDVLHSMNCTGSSDQTIAAIEKQIEVPALMRQDVTVTPSSAKIAPTGSIKLFAKTVSGQPAVWSLLEGSSAGTITQDGVYTSGVSNGRFHVVAIDPVKSNDYGIATITVGP